MEQSSIADLKAWVDELASHLDWKTGCSETGDWSFDTPNGVKVLVEPDPEMESRRLVFTAAVAKVDNETRRELLLSLLALNAAVSQPCAPILAYAPADGAITMRLVFQGREESWSGDNFLAVLEEFTKGADAMAGAIADGTLIPEDIAQQDQAGSSPMQPTYA